MSLCICLSDSLCLYLSVLLSVCLSVSVCLSRCLMVLLSDCLSVSLCLSVCLSLCICLSVQALSRPYVRAENRVLLTALNDSLLREFLKLLSRLKPPPSTAADDSMPAVSISMALTNISVVSTDNSMLVLSQILASYSHELLYLLSSQHDSAESDKLCDRLLISLPDVAQVCSQLLHSDDVS